MTCSIESISRDINEMVQSAYERGLRAGTAEHYDDHCFIETLKANVNNKQLTDFEFRDFVRTTLMEEP